MQKNTHIDSHKHTHTHTRTHTRAMNNVEQFVIPNRRRFESDNQGRAQDLKTAVALTFKLWRQGSYVWRLQYLRQAWR